MAMKHGFTSVEDYKENVQKKFSLLETGIIQQPSTRLLLINVGLAYSCERVCSADTPRELTTV
jgi:hypothetical protein